MHEYLEHIIEGSDYSVQDEDELDDLWESLADEIQQDAKLQVYASNLDWRF